MPQKMTLKARGVISEIPWGGQDKIQYIYIYIYIMYKLVDSKKIQFKNYCFERKYKIKIQLEYHYEQNY